ncbi:metallophosphoesterase [Mangrovitalea sediminis]|uniref:metallophosphoesterase n=1 Tax=Mangrovitalea sediminis TaxID=1982043 RepID=UPI000BE52D7E|nr:metallophosphoesterase [Mangrovitalea sediminis]
MPVFGFASDIHLSFYPKDQLPLIQWAPDVDVILLAGDIMDGVKSYAIDHVLRMTEGRTGLMTLGNHELYGIRRDKAVRELKRGFEGSHVTLLLNESVVIDGVRIAGTDLWTDFSLMGDPTRAMGEAERSMNDYRQIRVRDSRSGFDRFRKLRPADTLQWNLDAQAFIREELNHSSEPVVLMTHHAPDGRSVPERFRGHRLSPAYACNLSPLFEACRQVPVVNVHGHIHQSQNYQLPCGTWVLANPMGYLGHDEQTGFDPAAAFAVTADGQFDL